MRSGFSVCAKAFKCQVPFPRKLPRSTTCSFRVATLLRLETLAEYSRTSPARRGNSVSAGGKTLFELAGKGRATGLTAHPPTGFFSRGGSREPGGPAHTVSGAGRWRRTPIQLKGAPPDA